MKDITIPPEAVEAAARALAIENETTDKWWPLYMRRATASIRAALAAWPGRKDEWRDNINMLTGVPISYAVIILPLPQEARDE